MLERASKLLEKDDSKVQCRGLGARGMGTAAAAMELISMME